MGKKDTALYRYFQDEQRFADMLDVYVFEGKRMVRPTDIFEKDSRVTGMIGALKRRLTVQKYRDLIRRVAFHTSFVIVGLEHQDQVHYAMPIRVMLEDAAGYDEQMRRIQSWHRGKKDLSGGEWLGKFAKSDRVEPIVTILLYYGSEPWDGATDLHQLMSQETIPPQIMALVNNYQLHILDIQNFTQTEKFCTDLKEVFRFIQCANNKEALKALTETESERFENMDEETYDVITALTGSEELEIVKDNYTEKGGKINMCNAIKEMIADGRQEGKLEGRVEGELEAKQEVARNLFLRKIPAEEAAAICNADLQQVQEWYRTWG